MRRRKLLDVIIRTWEEACKEVDGLTPDRYVVGHISYTKKAICLGVDDEDDLAYHSNIENLVSTLIHETIHWVIWYREDLFTDEYDPQKYTCGLFDNIAKEVNL